MSASWPALDPRPSTVTTEDGVVLHVEHHGAVHATASVVLAHGYELDRRLWARQVDALLGARPELRVVTYDHRGHGRSGAAARETASISQLGRDLRAVVDSLPPGPVVLAGHSMGGMTILALAEQHPELVGARVVGAALLGSSANGSAELPGLPPRARKIALRVVPWFNALASVRAARGLDKPPSPGMRWLLFGTAPHRSDVLRTKLVLDECSAATCEAFYFAFQDHDRLAALQHLLGVPVLIAVGDRDRLAPPALSHAMAAELPHAQLVVYPGCGHMLQLERADDVSRRLLELVTTSLQPSAQTV
jgi:pimeloyl-ACP methyl ester carboxylesterase